MYPTICLIPTISVNKLKGIMQMNIFETFIFENFNEKNPVKDSREFIYKQKKFQKIYDELSETLDENQKRLLLKLYINNFMMIDDAKKTYFCAGLRAGLEFQNSYNYRRRHEDGEDDKK